MSGHAQLHGGDGDRRVREQLHADECGRDQRAVRRQLPGDADLDGERRGQHQQQRQPGDHGGGHERAGDRGAARADDHECPATPSFTAATATDACGSSFTLTSVDVTNALCGASYRVTRTWTASDACNNSSSASQVITVADTSAPVIAALPGPTTIECPATPSFTAATATDACGRSPTLTCADVTNALCGASYRVTRTLTASDAYNSASSAT